MGVGRGGDKALKESRGHSDKKSVFHSEFFAGAVLDGNYFSLFCFQRRWKCFEIHQNSDLGKNCKKKKLNILSQKSHENQQKKRDFVPSNCCASPNLGSTMSSRSRTCLEIRFRQKLLFHTGLVYWKTEVQPLEIQFRIDFLMDGQNLFPPMQIFQKRDSIFWIFEELEKLMNNFTFLSPLSILFVCTF